MPTLTGKTALVTGASRGMGRASALALAAAGAQVLIHYGRGANEADGIVAEIRKTGGRADAITMDLAAADGASKLARQARGIIGDRLDILVANAGVSKATTIEEMTVEDFDKLFAVNVPTPQRGHAGLDPGLIDEDQTSWIEAALPRSPASHRATPGNRRLDAP